MDKPTSAGLVCRPAIALCEYIWATMGSGDHGHVLLPTSLEEARIKSLPSIAYYIPDFISEDEERLILDKVRLLPYSPGPCPGD